MLALGLLCGTASALAQTYHCVSESGSYFSDRPCTGSTGGARLGAIGPQPQRQVFYPGSRSESTPAPQDHVKYLGAECTHLSEAIRTGPSRGVRGQTISDLRGEYARKCTVEEEMARRQIYEEQAASRHATIEARKVAEAERQAELTARQHCAAIQDSIQARRKRATELSEDQLAVLRNAEAAYNARCLKAR